MEYYYQHPGFIIAFVLIVAFMLILDLGIFNKKSHKVSNKEALGWSVTWIGLAMLFSIAIWRLINFEKFTEFQSAYWIEKALSVDNLFVFILVFKYFKVPEQYQHKVLFWGILGALIMRAIFIFAGVKLIAMTYLPETTLWGLMPEPIRINAILFIFGIFLIIAGYKSAFKKEDDENKQADYSKNIGARIVGKLFRVVPVFDGGKFFTVQNGKRVGTQLLVVVGVIEFTDLIFAIDSIPAIFAISEDPFILYTSNIFAILGLRSLYFLLANFIHMFHYLQYGLGFILAFIGVKMLINPLFHVPSPISLAVVGSALLLSVLASLAFKKK